MDPISHYSHEVKFFYEGGGKLLLEKNFLNRAGRNDTDRLGYDLRIFAFL